MNTDKSSSSFFQKLKAHRLLFFIALPVCFVLCVGLMCCLPKYYKSTFVVARESEQAVELNRAITLNQPQNYDLGIARTDNAILAEGYEDLILSDGVLYKMLDRPVQTMDGQFKGTCFEYLTKAQKSPFGVSALMACLRTDKEGDARSDSVAHWYTLAEVKAIKTLRSSITCDIDYESKIVTVTLQAQDPMAATIMARHLRDIIFEVIDQYEMEKMNGILEQLTLRANQAEAAFEAAQSSGDPDVAELHTAAESLRRQQTVYAAQMIHHPAFLTLADPTVDYMYASPSRWKIPLIITLLFGCILVCWVCRKEIFAYIMR